MNRNITAFNQVYLKDTSFANLMQERIFNVLLIASKYDAFMLEDDGRVDERIFFEYVQLNLRYPPRFTQVANEKEAFEELASKRYDLVMAMPTSENNEIFDMARKIKNQYELIPIVILTPFSREIYKKIGQEDLSAIDYIFSWLGNTDLLLAIIKLIEDKMNVEEDVHSVGVQVILLVEDSIRFYSSLLPHLYKFILKQSQIFATEALNEHQRMLRMRGRPKILLARTYEEAVSIYEKYKDNMLGIISDISFRNQGVMDRMAGVKFCEYVRSYDKYIPLIIESSEVDCSKFAVPLNAAFLDKNSRKLPVDLRNTILRNFGFGAFVFINPDTGQEIATVHTLKELQDIIFTIPDNSLYFHCSRNHISRWLYSRAMFPLAEVIKKKVFEELSQADEVRHMIFDSIIQYRKMKNRGVVAEFKRGQFDRYSNFARIGDGSLGGKGRGLAFIDSVLKRNPQLEAQVQTTITIPKTVVLCTDLFDEFMDTNNLYQVGLSDLPDEEILRYFLKGKLQRRLIEDFLAFFDVVKTPIAVRSSSLLEDSHYQPFAGIYSTYMIPCLEDKYEMLRLVSDAIKGVYASVFYKDSKAYMTATSNIIDQEKMAIILQEVVGTQYDDRYYPSFSGVARSLNYYPINNEKPEEGIANIAVGLGKYIVDGGVSLRFSPYWPGNVLQTSTLDLALRDTQTKFYALDMKGLGGDITTDDGANLLRIPIKDAEKDNSLRLMVSTYDPYDMMIRDGYYDKGRKVVTFANILRHDSFPLAEILKEILKVGAEEMGRPIEIEFAVNLQDKGVENRFYWLQIRPIVDTKEMVADDLSKVEPESTLLYSKHALGHGIFQDVRQVVYVRTENFRASLNPKIAREIEEINEGFLERKENYVLVGPGRWGSEDQFLGIPVKWPHISMARVIVETSLANYRIEPSQGTHFFQNLTSFGVGYFTINPNINDGWFDKEGLDRMPAVYESELVRVVNFEQPLVIKINGTKNIGVVQVPEPIQ
ncbi:MAG: PEP/pyruvate-binding domain-containing protein [Bacteroidales bacterium]